jgi:hypothetical protein
LEVALLAVVTTTELAEDSLVVEVELVGITTPLQYSSHQEHLL